MKRAPPVRIPGRRPSLTATRYSSCARDAVKEVQSQAGLTLQSISYANLKYGLTRRSASFCLRQSTLHDLSPKTSFRRPSSRRSAPRPKSLNLTRQTTLKPTRPPLEPSSARHTPSPCPILFLCSLPPLRKNFYLSHPQTIFPLLEFVSFGFDCQIPKFTFP